MRRWDASDQPQSQPDGVISVCTLNGRDARSRSRGPRARRPRGNLVRDHSGVPILAAHDLFVLADLRGATIDPVRLPAGQVRATFLRELLLAVDGVGQGRHRVSTVFASRINLLVKFELPSAAACIWL